MTMVTASHLQSSLQDLYSSIFDLPTEISECEPVDASSAFAVCYGKQDTNSVCFVDLQLANSLGAALPRIPAGTAEDATKSGNCPDNLQQNFEEIVNISTSLMRTDTKERIQLIEVIAHNAEKPETVLEFAGKTCFSFEVKVGNYPPGRLTVAFAG